EARVTSTELDLAAVLEDDRLVALALQDLEQMRLHLRPLRHLEELVERLQGRVLDLSGPDHQQTGLHQAEREDDARDQVSLANLTRDTQHDRVSRVLTIRSQRQRQHPGAILPTIEAPAETMPRPTDRRPLARHDPIRGYN